MLFMIAKHIPMKVVHKSHFSKLVKYITDNQNKAERVGVVSITNCYSGTVDAAIDEILATQAINTRATGDKNFHLIVSFRAGENLDTATLRAIEKRICDGLGYGDHQRISAVHHDTDNLHMHIAINKIHPASNKMHEPFHAYFTLAKLCDAIEDEYGLEKDNHQISKTISEGRAVDMERNGGIESLIGWIKRECLDEIRAAQSWSELHKVLQESDLSLRIKANGFVFEAGNGMQAKASSVSRDLSKAKLEARLGSFEARNGEGVEVKLKRRYKKDPIKLGVDTTMLYEKYKAAQQDAGFNKKNILSESWHLKKQKIEAAKKAYKRRRLLIKSLNSRHVNKRAMYILERNLFLRTMNKIHEEYRLDKNETSNKYKRHAWVDWLKKEALDGNEDALEVLRARKFTDGLKGNTIQTQGYSSFKPTAVADNITKKGTVIFVSKKASVRYDGNKIQVLQKTTLHDLEKILKLAMSRYGDNIVVNGTTQFKAQVIKAAVNAKLPISFADPILESRRQSLLDKEKMYDNNNANYRGRIRRGIGSVGRIFTNRGAFQFAVNSNGRLSRDDANRAHKKQGADGVGRWPPPANRNRLRTLSELFVVRIAGGSKVLLPNNVSNNVERKREKSDNELRWSVSVTKDNLESFPFYRRDQIKAMDKYIEQQKENVYNYFDISKYKDEAVLTFNGIKNVDGHFLALVKRDDTMLIMPLEEENIRRLERISIGDTFVLTLDGMVRTSRGKSR